MAEAAVETRPPNKFFCHQCSAEISPNLPEYTCPQCQSGFIEEITGHRDDHPAQNDHNNADPAAQFAELFSQSILQSFTSLDRDPSSVSEDDSEDDLMMSSPPGPAPLRGGPQRALGARLNPFLPGMMGGLPGTRISIRTHTPPGEGGQGTDQRNMALQNILQSILSGLIEGSLGAGGGQAAAGQFPFGGMLNMYGNPGDYAWGTGGLDNIITQLLNQIEGTGPPPADKDTIDKLTETTIGEQHTDAGLQCSVCMEDFHSGDKVKALPCDHMYHPDCILPWLELHGTCPVCRKPLTEQPGNSQSSRLPSSNQGPASRTRNQMQNLPDDEYD